MYNIHLHTCSLFNFFFGGRGRIKRYKGADFLSLALFASSCAFSTNKNIADNVDVDLLSKNAGQRRSCHLFVFVDYSARVVFNVAC
jgi:hypothetical protein